MGRPFNPNRFLYALCDEHCRVVVEKRSDRIQNPFRIKYWIVGSKRTYVTSDTFENACSIADSLFKKCVEQCDRKAGKIKTLKQLIKKLSSREHLSPKSKLNYQRRLTYFSEFVGPQRAFKSIDSQDVERYLDSISDRSDATRASYLRDIKCLFNFAIDQEWLDQNPARKFKVRVKHKIRPYLLPTEFEDYLSGCRPNHYLRSRFVLETGLRSSEVLNLSWDCLVEGKRRPFIIIKDNKSTGFSPKWGKARSIPLSSIAMDCLEEAKRIWKKGNLIFFNNKTKPGRDNLCRETHIACKNGNTTDIDFHGLRRSCAVRWLSNGVPINVVSQLLGHSEVNTTMKYYGFLMNDELARQIGMFEQSLV